MPADRVLCDHEYVLAQDSCPGCDHMSETPHPAKPVHVTPSWGTRPVSRCRSCGQVPSHRIHRSAR